MSYSCNDTNEIIWLQIHLKLSKSDTGDLAAWCIWFHSKTPLWPVLSFIHFHHDKFVWNHILCESNLFAVTFIFNAICYPCTNACIRILDVTQTLRKPEREIEQRSRKRNESKGKYVFDHIKIDDKLSRGNKLNLYMSWIWCFEHFGHATQCHKIALAELLWKVKLIATIYWKLLDANRLHWVYT